jgi:predicted DNA-binding protein
MGRHKREIETVSISSRVSPEDYETIASLAKSTERSISAYLRIIIQEHIESREVK